MSLAIRSLVSLPEDVLREILAHLLVDTPRSSTRAAVLRTCRLFYALGLPLLYRVVDLLSYPVLSQLFQAWSSLFGRHGLLTITGHKPELRRQVIKLRLGGARGLTSLSFSGFVITDLDLPRCTALVFGITCSPRPEYCPQLPRMLAQLPIQNLVILREPQRVESQEEIQSHQHLRMVEAGFDPRLHEYNPRRYGTVNEGYLGLDTQPWGHLDTVVFRDSINPLGTAHTGPVLHPTFAPPIPLPNEAWSFKTLVLDLIGIATPEIDCYDFIFHVPLGRAAEERYLRDVERIELRVEAELEDTFRKRAKKESDKAGGWSVLEQRILGKVVFIDENARSSRMVEAEGRRAEA